MPVYHSGNLSKTDRPDYNYPLRPQTKDLTLPLAPRNLMVTSPYRVGATDIRWDNPAIIPQNSGLNIVGCNVYRSTDSPYGPYVKVNNIPVTVLFYRDETVEQAVVNENATPTLRYSLEPGSRWLVYAQSRPVIMPGTNGKPSTRIQDIKVEIDNGDGSFLEMPAYGLNGITGEVELINFPVYNYSVQQIVPPRLPTPPNGRVRLSYSYLRHSVLTELSQRIYYKVTSVAADPNDGNNTIETPLTEISDRSAFDIEALDYIWREAILRNRWILEQGGERVKIFLRKRMGQVCPEHQQNYGQAYNDCHICFPAGTEVTMDDFTRKPIELIKINDMVLTHTGQVKGVKKIMERPINEDLIHITSIHGIDLSPTGNHPILIVRKEDSRCLRAKKYPCTGHNTKICNRKPWINPCNNELSSKIQWIEADKIKEGDYLLFPIPKDNESEDFSEAELRFMGYYAAEGHTSKRDRKNGGMTEEPKRVVFSFNRNEINTCIEDLRKSTEILGHHQCITKAGENGVNVTVTSVKLTDLVLQHIGKYAKYKKVSKRVVWQPIKNVLTLLGAYFNGDGCQVINESCTSISSSSASYQLARQFQVMLMRCGIISNFIARTRTLPNPLREGTHVSTSYELKIGKNFMNKIAQYSLYQEMPFLKSGWAFIDSGYIFYPVKKVNKEHHSGKVYNIEVEEDNSYIANGVAVHNCLGTGIVGGYSNPYDAIIAPPETDKMIELADMGLHIRYDWASWLTNYPLLNTRDVVVRQNNERYVVGPVNPQGSRGVIYQQHFTMSYIDQGDIRYQIPITGAETQVPASYDAYRQAAPTEASPVINAKPEVPQEKIIRGRTVTFENIQY